MSDTTVSIVGNVTRVELKFTPSGLAVCEFGVAVNKRVKDESGQWTDGDPQFYDCTAWRDLAENVAESVDKGTRVVVVGQLNFRTWEDNDGNKRSKVSITADAVGPDLRWATAEVSKNERRSESTAAPARAPEYTPEDEPFLVDAGDWEPDIYGSYPNRLLP